MVCGTAVLADPYTTPLDDGHQSGSPLPSFIPILIPILRAGPDRGSTLIITARGVIRTF